eukprot:scpid42325/ scgid28683/ 
MLVFRFLLPSAELLLLLKCYCCCHHHLHCRKVYVNAVTVCQCCYCMSMLLLYICADIVACAVRLLQTMLLSKLVPPLFHFMLTQVYPNSEEALLIAVVSVLNRSPCFRCHCMMSIINRSLGQTALILRFF